MVYYKRPEKEKISFRDRLATMDEKGKRLWVYAKQPKGKLTNYRDIIAYILLAFLFAGPFIKIGGNPILLLDFIDREIVIFGMQFWPQDFHLFFLAMISLFVFIILFTVTYGRVWCGWACPQTIFMENIFRKIEYFIEGTARDQKILNEGSWTFNKMWKKTLKHGIFYAISFLIGNTFLAYIIGIEELKVIVTDNPMNQIRGLIAMIVFSTIFYFVFSYLREQVCTTICPYGRLQGVLLDQDSIVISYDYKRGEPRGTFFKGEDRSKVDKGDCINCTQCVQVCPTGIDIRNGTQLECINCTACIDACNSMMDAVDLPRGLIRFASETMISIGKPWKFTVRSFAYSAVLVILLGLIGYLFSIRSSVEAIILRAPGTLFQEQPDGTISNLYNIKLINKTNNDMPVELKLHEETGKIKTIGQDIFVKGQTVGESVFFILFEKQNLKLGNQQLKIGVYSNGELIDEIETSFVGPKQ